MSKLFRVPALALAMVFASWVLSPVAQAQAQAYQPIEGVSPQPLEQAAGITSRADLEAFIDGVMNAQMLAQQTVGGVVAVVKDGQVLLAKGYGYADREAGVAMDAERTLVRPGSVSKLFTWTALMQLVEAGAVSLDADVNQYISQFQIPDTFAGQPITVRNLFTHSAGLEDGAVGFLIVDSEERLLAPADALTRYMPARVRPPASGDFNNGDMASYSNWATELAGLIVSNVSGLEFNQYIEQNIFEPLGMHNSTFRQPVPEALRDNLAVGYGVSGGQLKPKPFEYVMYPAAGSMSATASDIARFMIAHAQDGALGGRRILGEAAARQMHARALSPNPHLNGAALGFYENWVNGRRILVHAGNTTQFQTEFNLLIDEGVGLFFCVNSASTLGFSARRDLLHAFMDRYYPSHLPEVEPPSDFAERAADYVGRYRFNRHAYTTAEKAFSLLSGGLNVSASARNTLLLTGIGDMATEWVEVAPDTFRRIDDDATLAFSRDGQGQVAYLLNAGYLPSMQAYRVPASENPPLHWLIQALSALAFLAAVVALLRRWRSDREGPAMAHLARFTAALVGLAQLLFLVLFALSVSALTNNPLEPYPAIFSAALWLPQVALPLTGLMVLFSLLAWLKGWWSRWGRLTYSLTTGLAVAFLWSLSVWNLIGVHVPA